MFFSVGEYSVFKCFCLSMPKFKELQRHNEPTNLSLSAKYFSVHYCISGEYSDPCCLSQRDLLSFAIQTFASDPSENWSLCRYHYVASSSYFLDVCGERPMKYLSIHICWSSYNKSHSVLSTFVDDDCDKCGQTSRLVVGAKIQTIRHVKVNVSNCNCYVGCFTISAMLYR